MGVTTLSRMVVSLESTTYKSCKHKNNAQLVLLI